MKEREKRENREIIWLVLVLSTTREEKRERGVRSSTFSLRSMEIGPLVFVGVRGKVHLHDESFV